MTHIAHHHHSGSTAVSIILGVLSGVYSRLTLHVDIPVLPFEMLSVPSIPHLFMEFSKLVMSGAISGLAAYLVTRKVLPPLERKIKAAFKKLKSLFKK